MKTFLGIPKKELDVSRYLEALRCAVKWKQARGRGTILASTGFGKSMIAYLLIKKFKKSLNGVKVLIVVPRKKLQNQWIKNLKRLGLHNNVEVLVINTVALNDVVYEVDFLVLDEIHRFSGYKFRNVFTHVNYKWLLGLTATLEGDVRKSLVNEKCPVVHKVPLNLCKERGWVSNYIEINCPIPVDRATKQRGEYLSKQINGLISKFGSIDVAKDVLNRNTRDETLARLIKVHKYKLVEGQIFGMARKLFSLIAERSSLFYDAEAKVLAAVLIIKSLGLKTLTFSKRTDTADRISQLTDGRSYHSKVKSSLIRVTKNKTYKRKVNADKFAQSVTYEHANGKTQRGLVRALKNGFTVYYTEEVRASGERLCEYYSYLFEIGHCMTLNSAEGLNDGFDVEDVEMGIRVAGDSSTTTYQQRVGRCIREYDGIRAIFINLYVPNSQDEVWLKKSQTGREGIIKVKNVNELLGYIRTELKLGLN